MASSVDPYQTDPIGAVCSGSMLFASIRNSSVILGNYCSRRLQQTTFSDAFLRVNNGSRKYACLIRYEDYWFFEENNFVLSTNAFGLVPRSTRLMYISGDTLEVCKISKSVGIVYYLNSSIS